ncbi:acetyltransferase-like isoleucine patch superfamily enzyme [Ancylobacter sp. 3268]|uniref:CatB-related O-acetyltransferase n=1 Tax=Ancylobacter sp. 3268 TaxID=2817752 RepID=UPI0028630DAB|nr:CatB-related O-acetyltransferase [Ancylobacter sp. 3268]MDR6954121.1 acetyltransferase-like isoleucine patch superfamily enzyme [Ancylobacter sp. 3268]
MFTFPFEQPEVYVGKNCHINPPTVYYWGAGNKVSIGNYCSIASGTTFILGGEHPKASLSTNTILHQIEKTPRCKGDITIGHDVWLGTNAILLSGVDIGTGAIVGAGTVVSKNIEPYSVVVGNPMRIIRYRFSPPTISRLLHSSWWDMDPDALNEVLRRSSSVDEFLDLFEREHNLRGGQTY